MLDNQFTNDKIIYFLCKVRAKYAKQRGKKHLIHLLSKNPDLNHHLEERTADEKLLYEILPHRKQWKKLDRINRYKSNFQKLNIIDYNTKCIFRTVKYYQKIKPDEPFVIKLDQFITEIRNTINDHYFNFEKPNIYPKLKDKKDLTGKKKNLCRPISLYKLKDKIIICQTNKYLSNIFDPEFYELSHAFRPPVFESRITHHNSIQEILKYLENFDGEELYVAECDISKFYDSVNHKVISERFWNIVKRIRSSQGDVDRRAIRIFFKYLDSYNFVRDVLPLNDNRKHSAKYMLP